MQLCLTTHVKVFWAVDAGVLILQEELALVEGVVHLTGDLAEYPVVLHRALSRQVVQTVCAERITK